ncbi:hypothetical protein GALMADRAFT_766261 [Galerina marginata CBS 339.88]|uniref:Uncharacterized protein n=1 Tax=Galerina marginata (strain CBS 339.88) TaxID=685588 RepID=A0A067SQ96_GALM3|nr:hypothetical protein GALMADRAFT_766261 [Galerina marginata CBS 339.88]
MPSVLNMPINLLNLPNELISYIFVLAVLAPPFLSPPRPTSHCTTTTSRPKPIETRSPTPGSFTTLLLISRELRKTTIRTPQISASLSLVIPLLPNIGHAPPPGQRPQNPFQARLPYIHTAIKRARGGVLPLRLYLSASFPCPTLYSDANAQPLGLVTSARTAGWMRGDLAHLTMPLFRDLVSRESWRERWEVLDLTLPKHFCFEQMLESLSSDHAHQRRYEKLRTLALVCTHADKNGESSHAANGFLHSFKRNAPLLEDVTLILKTTLAPTLPPSPATSGTSTSTAGPVQTHHNLSVLTRYPTSIEVIHINASAREAIHHHASYASYASMPSAPTLSHSAQRMWTTLKRLTLDTYTTSMQLAYIVAHTPALEKLDVVMSGDDTGAATTTSFNFSPASLQDPQKSRADLSEEPRIVLAHMRTLVLRSASKLELLDYIVAPQLKGLYVEMNVDVGLASEIPAQALTRFLIACASPPASFQASQDDRMDEHAPRCQQSPNHPLQYLKLVSFPLSDASILSVLGVVPNLEELRMWWVGDTRGTWVEGLTPSRLLVPTNRDSEPEPDRELNLVPRLKYVEVHVSLEAVRGAEHVRLNEGNQEENKSSNHTPPGPPEIVLRLGGVVDARNAVYWEWERRAHSKEAEVRVDVPGPMFAMVRASEKLYRCEGCGSREQTGGDGKWDWERAGVEVGDEEI